MSMHSESTNALKQVCAQSTGAKILVRSLDTRWRPRFCVTECVANDPPVDLCRQTRGVSAAACRASLLRLLITVLLCLGTLTNVRGEISGGEQSVVGDVTATVSKSAVQVAEPLTFELTVRTSAASRVMFPSMPEKLAAFDVIDHHDMLDIPVSDDPGQRMWIRRVTLESIVTGDLQIPAMELQIVTREGTQTLKTEPVPVQVLSVLEDRADPTQFRDIQSVVDVEVPTPPSFVWLWWTLGGVGASLLSAAGVLLVVKRKTWITPSAWAIRELEQLQASAAMQVGDSETVCQEVSTILRDYLELQFDIPAPRQTTEELLQVIDISGDVPAETIAELGRLLKTTDQVRFAGLLLARDKLVSLIESAKQLTNSTIHTATGNTPNTPN